MVKPSKEFEKKLELYIKLIEEKLQSIAAVPNSPDAMVCEAMKYSLLAGGKRIRPVITIACAELFGGNIDDAVTVGCALECIHTYSLIHDDLPCMDNDDLRRGKPTCHKVFPENIALLAGDALLNKAFEIMSDKDNFISLNERTMIELVRTLSQASGTKGMIGGQVIDLINEKRDDVDIQELILMHKKKTGALIEAAASLGCIIGGVIENEEFNKISQFSSNLGLAFQIKDDILDVTVNEDILGKPIGSDKESGKNTFVTLLGLEKAEDILKRHTEVSISALEYFGDKAWFLKELAVSLLIREK